MDETRFTGLTTAEAQELLSQYGPNVLPEQKAPSELQVFFEQLKSPLVYILLISAVITLIL
ncbi:MAG: hypothetical protein H6765_00605 [Candidatus Peribacteria bacterium]|nr:MAG: hypothetical protein H6765_00605 [Candidatus Peribacteria bacterium]